MLRSDAINELAAALSKAQGQMVDALKDSSNPFFHSKYADLASVWDACRKPLSTNGLAIVQSVSCKDGIYSIETMLSHASGQFVSETLTLIVKEPTMQGIGSAITYGRRYQLAAFVGVAPDDDDDGNAASGKTVAKTEPVKPAPKPALKAEMQPTPETTPPTQPPMPELPEQGEQPPPEETQTQSNSKPCPIHPGVYLIRQTSQKTGKPYYGHLKEGGGMCFGK
jgi:hypothetical protein